jgi:hypothetical protein
VLKLKHNKKRNIGLLTEFFSKHISKSILNKQDQQLAEAKKIWSKYFRKDTELAKEYQLFTSLYEISVKNKEVAFSLIQTVKGHCKKQNFQQLEKEKTALIQEINTKINYDKQFFEYQVADYKKIATIQILLNSWRENNLNEIYQVADLEDKLLEQIIRQDNLVNQQPDTTILETSDHDIDALVVSIMQEKFNKKYENVLSEEQKHIINLYVFSQQDENHKKNFISILDEKKRQTLSFVEYEIANTRDKRNVEKLKEIREVLNNQSYDNINDDVITFFVHVCKLKDELREGENTIV